MYLYFFIRIFIFLYHNKFHWHFCNIIYSRHLAKSVFDLVVWERYVLKLSIMSVKAISGRYSRRETLSRVQSMRILVFTFIVL